MNKNSIKWEEPKCNLCLSNDLKSVFENLTYWEYPGKFRIVKCKSCGLHFTSPRPVLSEMEKYYESELYFGRDVKIEDSIDDQDNREMHYGPMYETILRKRRRGKIFDIGAGTGMLLSKFKENGWDVSGVELTHNAVNYAKKKYGIKLLQGDFLEKKINDKYDVVVLNGALEHLHKPYETLSKARVNLKKNGFILISIPNSDSIGRKLFGRNWFAWQPPRHLYHFSPETIKKMMVKAGYRNISISHSFDIQNKYILFQSARYMMSPKFKKNPAGGLVDQKSAFTKSFSPKKEFGKIFFKTAFYIIAKIEPIIQKGEVMIIYGEK